MRLDNGSDLHVSVVDDAIVVTMPGTSYTVTYHKRDEQWLVASDIRDNDNSPYYAQEHCIHTHAMEL
jgi:hypothetical protein